MNPLSLLHAVLLASARVTFAMCLGFLLGAPLHSQCGNAWLPGVGLPGTNGVIYTSHVWDPDGPGPIAPKLVIGGAFTLVGDIAANNIAAYDLVSGLWTPLGSGMNGTVRALTTDSAGNLVAGGAFTMAGGVSANRVARLQGNFWTHLGSGTNGEVTTLALAGNGYLAIGGLFSTAGGLPANNIVYYRTTGPQLGYLALGSGVNGRVRALLPSSAGIYAAGEFSMAGGVTVNYIASYNGFSWSALGGGVSGGLPQTYVSALAKMPNGDLVAAGDFGSAGGVTARDIARWNGTWAAVPGNGFSILHWIESLTSLANGDLVASYYQDGFAGAGIKRWDGATWAVVLAPSSVEFVNIDTLTVLPNTDVFVGGDFSSLNGTPCLDAATWSGVTWQALCGGNDGPIETVAQSPGGMVVGGRFKLAGGVQANNIARWNGNVVSALGSGLNDWVLAVATLSNGDIVAGGSFTAAGLVPANRVARWDGTNWSAMGGMDDQVSALAVMPNGTLVAGGGFTLAGGASANRIAQWDGTVWSPLGFGTNGPVLDLAILPNGDVVAAGDFTTAGGVSAAHIARWNGTVWSQMGSGTNGRVRALAALPNGDVIAGGDFTLAGSQAVGYVARWNGTAWSAMGTGMNNSVHALAVVANGDVVAGGAFMAADGSVANFIARWGGTSWLALGSGMSARVAALTTLPGGDLVAGGDFTLADGAVSAYLARLSTTCPATTVAYGAGCAGPGGALSLTAADLPWTGSTFEVKASVLGAASFGLVMLSLGQIPPGVFPINPGLLGLVPGPGVGCDLLIASLDYNTGLVPVAGVATWQLPLAPIQVDPTLPGVTFYLQVAELDFSSGWVGTYTTNGLTCTVGAF